MEGIAKFAWMGESIWKKEVKFGALEEPRENGGQKSEHMTKKK